MARPTCPKPNCSGTSFEARNIEPSGSTYRPTAICCSGCGAVVSVIDFFNIGTLIYKPAKKLNVTLD